MRIKEGIRKLKLKMMTRVGKRYINGSKDFWNREMKILENRMTIENIGIGIYTFIIHENTNYHCVLFEDKNIKFILPFEREIENILIDGRR